MFSTATDWDTRCAAEEFNEDELNVSEKSDRVKGEICPWKSDNGETTYFILRDFLKKFCNFESIKGKVLEADSHLEGTMVMSQGIQKMLAP